MTRFTRNTPGCDKNKILKKLQRRGLERVRTSTYVDPDGSQEDTDNLAAELDKQMPSYSDVMILYVTREQWSHAFILQGPEPYLDRRQMHFEQINPEAHGT